MKENRTRNRSRIFAALFAFFLLLSLPAAAEAAVTIHTDAAELLQWITENSGRDKLVMNCDEALYAGLVANTGEAIRTMREQAGIAEADVRFSETSFGGTVYFEHIVWKNGEENAAYPQSGTHALKAEPRTETGTETTVFTTVHAVFEFIDGEIAEGKTAFTVPCTEELCRILLPEYYNENTESDPLAEIFGNCGVDCWAWYEPGEDCVLELEAVSFLPGAKIVRAFQQQDLSQLNERERQTCEAAEKAAAELKQATEPETARAIHDWLCESITYTVDETTEEDDSAIGALLSGQANCDGYADAFYTVCSLAGIEVRYQVGFAHDTEEPLDRETMGHEWNLIRIRDEWLAVDVTWDDDDRGRIYDDYFAVGADGLKETHVWEKDATVPIAEKTPAAAGEIDAAPADTPEGSSFEIHYLDVGQGDAALILCDGEAMLIDGGTAKQSSFIYAYLQKLGITRLEYIVGSHADADHVGGLSGALHYVTSIGEALCTTTEKDTDAFRNFKKFAAELGCEIRVPDAGEHLSLGSADVWILAPEKGVTLSDNTSLVMKVTYGNTAFLFTGDAELEDEADLVEKMPEQLKSTVLKVGHHGSNSSTSYSFLYYVEPEYAVISVGADNDYGHPTENVLSRLEDADVKIYRTDLSGTIICRSDGESVTFETEK